MFVFYIVLFLHSVVYLVVSIQWFFFFTMLYLCIFFFLFFAYLVVFCKIGLVSPVLMLQGSYVMFSHTLSNKIYVFYLLKKKKRSIKPPSSHHTPSKKPIPTFAHLKQFQNPKSQPILVTPTNQIVTQFRWRIDVIPKESWSWEREKKWDQKGTKPPSNFDLLQTRLATV